MELKEGMICVMKDGSWFKSINNIKDRTFAIVQLGIKIATLSRYTHVFTIVKEKNKWYIVDSTCKLGISKRELCESWLQECIENNTIDIFEQKKFNKRLFTKKLKPLLENKYFLLGILNIGLFNTTGKYFTIKKENKYFCSHLTSYLHNIKIKKEFYLNSPADIAHCNNLRRLK